MFNRDWTWKVNSGLSRAVHRRLASIILLVTNTTLITSTSTVITTAIIIGTISTIIINIGIITSTTVLMIEFFCTVSSLK